MDTIIYGVGALMMLISAVLFFSFFDSIHLYVRRRLRKIRRARRKMNQPENDPNIAASRMQMGGHAFSQKQQTMSDRIGVNSTIL